MRRTRAEVEGAHRLHKVDPHMSDVVPSPPTHHTHIIIINKYKLQIVFRNRLYTYYVSLLVCVQSWDLLGITARRPVNLNHLQLKLMICLNVYQAFNNTHLYCTAKTFFSLFAK